MSYDVLAVRAQREEAAGDPGPWKFTLGDAHFELPSEPPAEMLPQLAELAQFLDKAEGQTEMDASQAVGVMTALPKLLDELLGEDDAARLRAFRLSIQDVTGLLTTYMAERVGGGGLGESQPSPTSSPPTPRTQRRTSKRTTGSTSRRTTAAK